MKFTSVRERALSAPAQSGAHLCCTRGSKFDVVTDPFQIGNLKDPYPYHSTLKGFVLFLLRIDINQ